MLKAILFLLLVALILTASQGMVPSALPSIASTSTAPTTVQSTRTSTSVPSSSSSPSTSHSPSLLPSLSPSPSPAPVVTVIPFGSTPSRDESGYALNTWDAKTAWQAYQEISAEFPQTKGDSPYGEYEENSARVTFLREFIARFPYASNAGEAKIDLVYFLARNQSLVEPFRAQLEQAFNYHPGISIDLNSIGGLLNDSFGQGRFELKQLLPANNIFGDGQPGWILEIWTADNKTASFLLNSKSGVFQLKTPFQNWDYVPGWNERRIFTQDLNVDGIPEISIWNIYRGIGMTHYCGKELVEYQWDGQEFVNLTPYIYIDANTNTGDCLDFEFTAHTNNPMTITTGIAVSPGIASDSPFANLKQLRTYAWNGSYFSLANETVQAPNTNPRADISTRLQLLSWVDEAGPTNIQAYQLLPSLLMKTDPSLLAGWTEIFGPAYTDYFRFKLGTWYAMRGYQSPAVSLLTQVRDHPADPEYSFASQLAGTFLMAYQTRNAYQGCNAVNQSLDFSSFRESDWLDLEMIRSQWGYADPFWSSMTSFGSQSGPSGRDDAANVCPLQAAFRLALQGRTFSSKTQIEDWLTVQNIPYTGLYEGDANQDGRKDWTALLGTGSGQEYQLWLLLNQGSFLLPLRISDCCTVDSGSVLTAWGTFQPEPSGSLVNVYMQPNAVIFYRVVSHETWKGIEILERDENPYRSSFYSFEVTGGSDTQSLTVNIYDSTQNSIYSVVHGWDPLDQQLALVDSPEIRQEKYIQSAENLLFVEKDTKGAFEVLDYLFDEDNPLSDSESSPTVRPYLLYLRGLGYEMAGNFTAAVDSYWTLWYQYPSFPLAYIAQRKLIPNSP
jgi:hypothetical protein